MANLPPLAATPRAPKKKTPTKKPAVKKGPITTDTGFVLSADLAIPARARSGGGGTRYPFADLKVGMSFIDAVEHTSDEQFKEDARKASNRMSGA